MAEKKRLQNLGNWLKFLGTAGARFVMIKQLRASGGIWLSFSGSNILIDPGPGSLVKCALSRPKLDPSKLDAIILTHKHLDHSNDINVMIEAMTGGGFKKRGRVFLPLDALDVDAVVLRHARNFPEEIVILKENSQYEIGKIKFTTPKRQIHTVETYGLKFKLNETTLSLITDTLYFKGIKDFYKADIIIINVVFYEPRPGVEHLSLQDAITIIQEINPKIAILTHFGMTMLKAKPHDIAMRLTKELGINVIAAYDGMRFELP
ncbi:MAG: MBL fold metallo-hydrolase [Candidatus Omnitrophota bacterium]|nr:MBL fold metallo-hydrolase [Candidatus Omnitrophota bacterium]